MKRLIVGVAVLLTTLSGMTQQNWCGSDYLLQEYLNESAENRLAFEEQQSIFKAAEELNASRAEIKFIIPVVVHVLYNTCNGNISRSQIDDALRIINEDYGRTNADTILTRDVFKPVAADAQIEFRLARIDPNGNSTDGIVRIQTSAAVNAGNNVKSLSNWTSSKYLNIWVVETINNFVGGQGTILGYAQFPGQGSWNSYGIVIRNDAMGTIGTSNADGRTLTHEVGHCLNLYHTFQDGCGFNCGNSGDYVCDTPPAIEATYDCNSSTNTCSNDANGSSAFNSNVPDMIENYMSYNSCQNLFTEGQRTRMHAVLSSSNVLNGLSSSSNLISTGVQGLVEADFQTEADLVCQWSSVDFQNTSLYDAETFAWDFTDLAVPATSTESNPRVVFPFSGLMEVKLSATSGSETKETTKSIFVVSKEGHYVPSTDDMENFSALPSNNWLPINIDQDAHGWKVSTEAFVSGTQSIKMDNYGNCGERSDELISQSYDFSPFTSVIVTFKQAFAQTTAGNSDYLRLFISNDCGENWTMNWVKTGNGLRSVTTPVSVPFVPTSEEWNDQSLTITGSQYMQEGILFKFEFGSRGGNNLYIDDFAMNGTFSGDLLLRSPENGKQGLATDVTIDWKAVGFVDSYEYQVDKVNTFDSQDLISGTNSYIDPSPENSDTEASLEGLSAGETYYWRVRYNQSGTVSEWSETWNFTVSESGVGISELVSPKVTVYPNPATNQVMIQSESNLGLVQLFDYTGRMVWVKNAKAANTITINSSELPRGFYLLKIEDATGAVQTKPLVLQ
jgi:hypothetical protein